MSWSNFVNALYANRVFLAGLFCVPGFVLVIVAVIRTRLNCSWTSAADAFIALTTLEFGLLYNIRDISPHINQLFSKYFVQTFELLALASMFLTIWALFVESDIVGGQKPRMKIVFLWTCALTLTTVNLYVLAGLGGWKG